MHKLPGTQTEINLAEAFVGKSQLTMIYTWIAKKAKKDGFEQIAAILYEASGYSQSHAKSFFRFLEGGQPPLETVLPGVAILDTGENLRQLIEVEQKQIEFCKRAEKKAWQEGFKKVSVRFRLIARIGEELVGRLSRLLGNIESDRVFEKEEKVKWICRKCGFVYESKKALKNCPACEHPQAYFEVKASNF